MANLVKPLKFVLAATLVLLLLIFIPHSSIKADTPPVSSVYDGVGVAGPVNNPSPIPCVGGEIIALIQDNIPWYAPANQDPLGANVTELKAQNKKFCIVNSKDIGTTNLAQFQEILISAAQTQTFYNNLFPGGAVHAALTAYVQQGGILSANVTDYASGPGAGGNWFSRSFVGGLTHTLSYSADNNVADSSSPIITGQFGGTNGGQIVDTSVRNDLDGWSWSSHGYFTNLPSGTKTIIIDGLNRPVTIEYPFGTGKVIATLTTTEWRYVGGFAQFPQNRKLLANEIGYQASLQGTEKTLPEKAAELAKTVIGARYLWGGKGWDWNAKQYVEAGKIQAGYDYLRWDPVTKKGEVVSGLGLDCSGLIMWAYNKASGTTGYQYKDQSKKNPNLIFWENADQQFQYNSEPVNESDLKAGDLLFFDWNKDEIMDHVAMYVGGDDVANAANKDDGIIWSKKSELKDKATFRRRTEALVPPFQARAYSPVTLMVTDPDGFTITAETQIITEWEYLREIPRQLYYSQWDTDGDGKPEETVFAPILKTGGYLIKVLPKPGAAPTDTYSLEIEAAGKIITLAQNVPISNIPSQGYGIKSTGTDITVNQPPTARAGGPYNVLEGGTVALDGSGSDPEGGPLTYAWDIDGNGTFETLGKNPSFSAAGLDGPTGRTAALRVIDDGGLWATSGGKVYIANAAPSVTITGPAYGALYAVGTTVNLSASFTDAGIPDTHSASINWDDGSTSSGSVTEAGGSGTVSASHTFAGAGVYSIQITLTDDDGGSDIKNVMVVVYDPSAGFVTGGGWLNSPAGAYRVDLSLSGRANFGFVSKYQKGSATPTGQTEFQFQVANLNFHSDTYQWLVISGAKAQYKGTGTINGSPGYGFLLTATDGQVSGGGGVDKFRIKIWKVSDGSIVYDNVYGGADDIDAANPQVITEGSIVIHK